MTDFEALRAMCDKAHIAYSVVNQGCYYGTDEPCVTIQVKAGETGVYGPPGYRTYCVFTRAGDLSEVRIWKDAPTQSNTI